MGFLLESSNDYVIATSIIIGIWQMPVWMYVEVSCPLKKFLFHIECRLHNNCRIPAAFLQEPWIHGLPSGEVHSWVVITVIQAWLHPLWIAQLRCARFFECKQIHCSDAEAMVWMFTSLGEQRTKKSCWSFSCNALQNAAAPSSLSCRWPFTSLWNLFLAFLSFVFILMFQFNCWPLLSDTFFY